MILLTKYHQVIKVSRQPDFCSDEVFRSCAKVSRVTGKSSQAQTAGRVRLYEGDGTQCMRHKNLHVWQNVRQSQQCMCWMSRFPKIPSLVEHMLCKRGHVVSYSIVCVRMNGRYLSLPVAVFTVFLVRYYFFRHLYQCVTIVHIYTY